MNKYLFTNLPGLMHLKFIIHTKYGMYCVIPIMALVQ